ncbi:hypothetical protein [Acinetobacter tjernbergiae]|uniref:Universal stress protein B n=1 Tax=Acinetobacter tjernbergiae DSM 14971 = CIP 107465 TaxID=1120928 RepID=V2UVL8_9GAMM|nr:hypothetical protein [Acinetobacter tjernbergiae]ESK54052.1 hypothetical protein F990_03008 [Acinetobacter tjernbergiae DSM 14971 = CIP 107465]
MNIETILVLTYFLFSILAWLIWLICNKKLKNFICEVTPIFKKHINDSWSDGKIYFINYDWRRLKIIKKNLNLLTTIQINKYHNIFKLRLFAVTFFMLAIFLALFGYLVI